MTSQKKDTYKCAFPHCQHSSCEIPRDEAVKVGARYMHKDCATVSEYMQKTVDLYYEQVSNTVVIKMLRSVLNNIIFKKKVDPKFLYFALDFAIKNKIPIKSPYSLHYLVDNSRIKDLWKKKAANEIVKQMQQEIEETISQTPFQQSSFNYSNATGAGFGSIFGGR